jgi:hypothetical protein
MIESEPLMGLSASDEAAPEEEYQDDEETRRPSKRYAPIHHLYSGIEIVRDHLRAWKNFYFCALLIVALEFPMFLNAAPGIQLMEDAICRDIYKTHTDPDACQSKEVLTKIARVRGVLAVLAVIPSTCTLPIKSRRLIKFKVSCSLCHMACWLIVWDESPS